MIPTHRGYAKQIGKGVSLKRMMAEFFGEIRMDTGKGKDITPFYCVGSECVIGQVGPPSGSQFPILRRIGTGRTDKGKKGQVCVTFFGDGSSNRGTFHESFQFSASLWKLPIVWICENNKYFHMTSTHKASYCCKEYCRLCKELSNSRDHNRWE